MNRAIVAKGAARKVGAGGLMPGRPMLLRLFTPAITIAILGITPYAKANEPAFDTWLNGVKSEARERGITAATIDAALTGLEPIPRVIELDRRQPEFTLTFEQYLANVVSKERVAKGRERLRENASLLKQVAARHHVQPRFIVALWGIETDFGRLKGGFPVVSALATLAYDGRRPAYFRKELFDALTILDQGHITVDRMTGSWAGAMGQTQFMPSSFVRYAVDGDGDGRRDIWTTRLDVFASSANYLKSVGWRDDQTWGRKVRLPPGFSVELTGLSVKKRLSEWQALGVRRADGRDLPRRDLPGSIILPESLADRDGRAGEIKGPAFVVYANYEAILRWNRAHFFAMAVGLLSDAIAGR